MKLWTEAKVKFYRYRFAWRCAVKVFWIQAEDLRDQAVEKISDHPGIIKTNEEMFMKNWRDATSAKIAKMMETEMYVESTRKGAFYG